MGMLTRGGDEPILSQDLLLVKILRIVVNILPKIELPKRRGRPYIYTPQVMACCFLVMVAKRFSKRGLYTFLTREDDLQAQMVRKVIPFPEGKIPNRRTFDRRLSDFVPTIQLYLLAGAQLLVDRTSLGISRLTADNRMFPACGSVWHAKDRKRGIIPEGLRNVDTLAGWAKSAYRGWVFGHGLDVIVTTGKLVVPVLAIAHSLTTRGNTALKQTVHLLPKVRKGVLAADSEYEDRVLKGYVKRTGRSFHVASKRDPIKTPKSQTYRRRKTTVEPFFERFMQALLVRGKLPLRGKQAWGWLMVGTLLYQVAVIYQVLDNNPNPLRVTHLIHTL